MELWQKIKSKMLAHPNQTVSEKGCSLTYEELIVYAGWEEKRGNIIQRSTEV